MSAPDWKHNRTPDTSFALTEARTVLSRAETALQCIAPGWRRDDDPDADEIKSALEEVISKLDRWRKCRDSKCEGRMRRPGIS